MIGVWGYEFLERDAGAASADHAPEAPSPLSYGAPACVDRWISLFNSCSTVNTQLQAHLTFTSTVSAGLNLSVSECAPVNTVEMQWRQPLESE